MGKQALHTQLHKGPACTVRIQAPHKRSVCKARRSVLNRPLSTKRAWRVQGRGMVVCTPLVATGKEVVCNRGPVHTPWRLWYNRRRISGWCEASDDMRVRALRARRPTRWWSRLEGPSRCNNNGYQGAVVSGERKCVALGTCVSGGTELDGR